MKYFTKLSDDEIIKICLAFPHKEMSSGFKKFSKDFSILMPGHRPQSVNEEVGRKLISNNPRSGLTAKMVEALLSLWISKVTATAEQQINNGREKDIAYMFAFSEFAMPGCISIYFNLVGEEISEERIASISSGVEALLIERTKSAEKDAITVVLTQLEEEKNKHREELRGKNLELKSKTEEVKALSAELAMKDGQIESLSLKNLQIEKLNQALNTEKEKLSSLAAEKKKLETRLAELQKENEDVHNTVQHQNVTNSELYTQLEAYRLRLEEINRTSEALMNRTYQDSDKELRPVDADDFTECLAYNLKSIGISDASDFGGLLKGFLSEILLINL